MTSRLPTHADPAPAPPPKNQSNCLFICDAKQWLTVHLLIRALSWISTISIFPSEFHFCRTYFFPWKFDSNFADFREIAKVWELVNYWCLTSCQLLRDIKTTPQHYGGGGVVVEDNGVNITNSLSEPCLQGRNTGTRWKRQGSILYFSKPDVQYILLKY